MDAFFASVEQRDFPELKGKPIAVGGSKERGVVAAASYEARKFGVKSAMSSKIAFQKCPSLIFQPVRFEVYKEVSKKIQTIFREYTDLVEPLSLDEAYLDVTENKKGIESATEIANEIRERIWKECHLTASAGISCNKFVAKMASDINKPNGFCVIKPKQIEAFLMSLPISKFYGIGKVTSTKLNQFGIYFGSDLKKLSLPFLEQHFGKSGKYYFEIIRGIDNRIVNPNRIRKSVGAETTFENDLKLDDIDEIKRILEKTCDIVWKRITKNNKQAKTITLKIKYADFNQITRSNTLVGQLFTSKNQVQKTAYSLLENIDITDIGIRLLGVTLSNFSKKEIKKKQAVQLTLDF